MAAVIRLDNVATNIPGIKYDELYIEDVCWGAVTVLDRNAVDIVGNDFLVFRVEDDGTVDPGTYVLRPARSAVLVLERGAAGG